MNGYDAFQIYQAVRLHFTGDFDYFKYHGRTRTSQDSFERRKDKYLFHKIARMYSEEQLPYFFAINILKTDKAWVSGFLQEDAANTYDAWLAWQKDCVPNFTGDCRKIARYLEDNSLKFGDVITCVDGQFPLLFTLRMQNEIAYDTLVILDYYFKLFDGWNKKLEDDFIWSDFYKKANKYKPFLFGHTNFNTTAFKLIIMNNLPLQKD